MNKGTWARVLADSICPEGIRLTTLLVRLPRIVLAELNTHRMLSRNCASSRAIPVEKRIAALDEDCFIPAAFAANQKGMVAGEQLDAEDQDEAKADWEDAMRHMSRSARLLASRGVHKQWANRLIEPFSYVEDVITATEWSNFFALRISPHAQPEIREAAEAMKAAMDASTPWLIDPNAMRMQNRWHLPLVDERDFRDVEVSHQYNQATGIPLIVGLSVARCARVSYLTHEGKRDIAADLRLYRQLTDNGHLSPAEHCATPFATNEWRQIRNLQDSIKIRVGDQTLAKRFSTSLEFNGNFRGWTQYRKFLPFEADFGARPKETT